MPRRPALLYSPNEICPKQMINFRGQNYEEIKMNCLQKQVLFVDDQFRTNEFWKGNCNPTRNKLRPQWNRPPEVDENAVFFVEKNPHGLSQGIVVYNCWFAATLCAVMGREDLVNHTTPPGQSFSENYAGIFRFRFYQQGHLVEVVVDDTLPFVQSPAKTGPTLRPVGMENLLNPNDYWCALIEKAYAKLHGTFCQLHSGNTREAFNDLAGGVTENISLKRNPPTIKDLSCHLFRTFEANGMITVVTGEGGPNIRKNGLARAHSYTILRAEYVQSDLLLLIRNPWNLKSTWDGRWGFQDSVWKSMDPVLREKLTYEQLFSSNSSWILLKDVMIEFEYFELWHHSPSGLRHFNEPKLVDDSWQSKWFHGAWVPFLNIGGRKRTTWEFPKVFFQIQAKTNETESAFYACLFHLNHRVRDANHTNDKRHKFIGMVLWQQKEIGKTTTIRDFENGTEFKEQLSSGPLSNCVSVTLSGTVGPGVHALVLKMAEMEQNEEFILQISSTDDMNILNLEKMVRRDGGMILVPHKSKTKDGFRRMLEAPRSHEEKLIPDSILDVVEVTKEMCNQGALKKKKEPGKFQKCLGKLWSATKKFMAKVFCCYPCGCDEFEK